MSEAESMANDSSNEGKYDSSFLSQLEDLCTLALQSLPCNVHPSWRPIYRTAMSVMSREVYREVLYYTKVQRAMFQSTNRIDRLSKHWFLVLFPIGQGVSFLTRTDQSKHGPIQATTLNPRNLLDCWLYDIYSCTHEWTHALRVYQINVSRYCCTFSLQDQRTS